ncbi:MAG: hypothetical protein AB9903_09805 [Vulcanimicrobiota bacterium]
MDKVMIFAKKPVEINYTMPYDPLRGQIRTGDVEMTPPELFKKNKTARAYGGEENRIYSKMQRNC